MLVECINIIINNINNRDKNINNHINIGNKSMKKHSQQYSRYEVEQGTFLLGVTGSTAYGLKNVVQDQISDTDYRGVFVRPLSDYCGVYTYEQMEYKFLDDGELNGYLPSYVYDPVTLEEAVIYDTKTIFTGYIPQLNGAKDTVIYEVRKFLQMLQEQNPNIIELLWLDEDKYIVKHPWMANILINNREKLLSKKVKHTYIGYADDQIRRMENHRKWILKLKENPDFYMSPPNKEDYLVVNGKRFPDLLKKMDILPFYEFIYFLIKDKIEYSHQAQELGKYILHGKGDTYNSPVDLKACLTVYNIPPEIDEFVAKVSFAHHEYLELLKQSKKYLADVQEYKNYLAWSTNRNYDRKKIEELCGYDGKHAAHCLRLLQTGIEILNGEGVIVNRRDVDSQDKKDFYKILLSVRKGEISYSDLMKFIDILTNDIKEAYNNTQLPDEVPLSFINDLSQEILLYSL